MSKPCAIFLLSLFASSWGQLFLGCELIEKSTGQNSFSARSESRYEDDVVTTHSIYEILDDSYETPKVEVERSITDCEGKQIVHVKVSVKSKAKPLTEPFQPLRHESNEELRFYESGAKNAVVFEDGKYVKRINELDEEGYGGVLTNRALNDDELFEVRLERLTIKYDDSLGIGVTHHTPTSIDYLNWMPCGTIILFDHRIYEHGVVSKKKYGANLKTLKVGDRVGVMKKTNGDLHFFINGEDQGVAKSNVTYPVHGVIDVYGKAVEVSITSKDFE